MAGIGSNTESDLLRPILLLLLLSFAVPAQAWWDCNWKQRFPVDVVAPNGPSQSNYMVRLDLNSGNVPGTLDWSLNGTDLRAIANNDLTPLEFVIEQWNSGSETAVVWVRIPSLSGTQSVYLYFDGPPGAPTGSVLAAMPEPGMQFSTRRSTIDPNNRASAEAAYESANPNVGGYGCAIINAYTNVSNRSLFSPPSRDTDIALSAEVFFDVGPGDAGTWEFRYGADFGFGGGLYVDDIALEEQWNDNLWWAGNWNNSSQVLQGTVSLGVGTHSVRILGFEDCCDGGLTAQFRRPGGSWQDLALTNIALRGRSCTTRPPPTISFGVGEISPCATLLVNRAVQPLSNAIEGTSNPKAIPGAIILNVTEIENTATGAVDAGSMILTEQIAAGTALVVVDYDGATQGPVRFVDGSPASGITYNFGSLSNPSDDLYFSSNGGVSYSYSPTPDVNGVDEAVTHIQLRPTTAFAGASGAGNPSAEFRFKTRIK
jgi:hypothetical protein